MLAYQILTFTIFGKIEESHAKAIDLKYVPQHGATNLNYLMDHFLCLRFRYF